MADPVSLAITVALTAAQMAMTALQHFEGPRLTDLKASVADYGTPLNYVHGRRKIACPAFFAEPIKEKKKKRKGKGGKQTSYTGFATFAVHLADHPIGSVRKVWFDQHLVYDATGSGDPLFPLAKDYELASFMRIYLGTPGQERDPRMLAFLEARNGAGTCPAYLDTAYLFFEDVPIEQIGNRFPQVRAEITTVATGSVALCFALDRSTSMAGERLTTLKSAMASSLAYVAGVIAPGVTIDLGVVTFGDPAQSITRRAIVAGDVTSVDAWVQALTAGASDTDFRAGMDAASIFFSATAASITRRVMFFVTDGEPTDAGGTSAAAVAAGAAATLAGMAGVQSHGINIGLTNTTYTAQVDNTPGDGVPVVSGANPGALSNAVGNVLDALFSTDRLGAICAAVAARCGLDSGSYDFTALDQPVPGYSWTQGSGRQILEPLLTLFDSQLRPHDFLLQGIKRGGAAGVLLSDGEFTAGEEPGEHYRLSLSGDTDLPQRLSMTYADLASEQQPNTAVVQRSAAASGSVRDQALDLSTVALAAGTARQLLERYHRRIWFARAAVEFGLSRRRLAIEPGDVHPVSLDGSALTLACDKLTLQGDGVLAGEWVQDDPALAVLSGAAGAVAAGHVPSVIFTPADTTGAVLDLPLLSDVHDQSAPFAYLVAAPKSDTGTWPGADFAVSDTGELDSYTEGWGAVSSGSAAVFGVVTGALRVVDPWVFDDGSSVSVVIESGALAGATIDDLLVSGSRNLALIGPAGGGGELVQFRTATLTAPLTYTLAGFVRGVGGSEAAVAGHVTGERFVLLEGAAVPRTLGAAELGDTDWYIASTVGRTPAQASAKPLAFTGQAHRPYAPIRGRAVLSAGDWSITATRRTRIGGASVNGQDVPLGEVSQAWEAEVMDGATVKRVLTGTALPLVYTAAMQTTDWGAAQTSLTVRLYQINPALSLRGALLTITG